VAGKGGERVQGGDLVGGVALDCEIALGWVAVLMGSIRISRINHGRSMGLVILLLWLWLWLLLVL